MTLETSILNSSRNSRNSQIPSVSKTTAQEKGEQKAPEWFMLHSPVTMGRSEPGQKNGGTGPFDEAIVGKWVKNNGIAWVCYFPKNLKWFGITQGQVNFYHGFSKLDGSGTPDPQACCLDYFPVNKSKFPLPCASFSREWLLTHPWVCNTKPSLGVKGFSFWSHMLSQLLALVLHLCVTPCSNLSNTSKIQTLWGLCI